MLVKMLEIKTFGYQDFGDQDCQDFGDQDMVRGLARGLLILWPYTPGFTTSVHRGLPDVAIPIRDPGLTCHELFANYG